jgi:aspartate/methionine/tyrosine aminotransferase
MDPFKLERYFSRYEFNAKYLLSSSDCDGFSLDYVLSKASLNELKLWNSLTLGYRDSTGDPFLREAISRHYNTIKVDEVFVLTPGEANYILMMLILKAGDEIVCMKPAYQSLYQVAREIGCYIKFWEPDNKGSFNPDDLQKLVTEKTRILVVNFPHNPTGYYPSKQELDVIISIASRYNTFLYSDEMYHKLVHDPSRLNDSLVDLYENSISLWGTAKSFGLAGLRIGWVVSHNQSLLEKMKSFRDYLSICNSAPSEILASIALNNSEEFIEVNLEKIRRNKIIFAEFVNRHASFIEDYIEPAAGSTALVKLNLSETTLDYTERLVKETGIMTVPAEMFDYGHSHIRIGFGRANMAEALHAWERVLSE